MDMTSVCLAVLTAWTVALLAALTARRPDGLGAPSPSRALRALWPIPPPRRTLLSQLSVLRI
ncbi:hypothetical protein [Streptomyces sp. H27-D2]|uniref:hypothetical protein n=1 Tax=Streptomyces sp. H27-D2 TaxID=3046304 RepID=UPI002DBC1FDE|nr:hypothetical protein [Streptomyces sp. H27-D2]MEC4017232.1 hypothetical protein [Streptomyces sp. H27-D2]